MKTLIASAFVAIATVAFAPTAHADEADYINHLDELGVPIVDSVLPLGYSICSDISANGTYGVERQAQMSINAGVDAYTAAAIISAAVWDLCPSNTPALTAWMNS